MENEKEFDDYVGKCKEPALYDTGVTARYGDRLITLTTCEYSAQSGRLVVVAKFPCSGGGATALPIPLSVRRWKPARR